MIDVHMEQKRKIELTCCESSFPLVTLQSSFPLVSLQKHA
jgi:hypothetical protein